jgi:hypothetical protein
VDSGARQAAADSLSAICEEIDYPDDMALGYLLTTKVSQRR